MARINWVAGDPPTAWPSGRKEFTWDERPPANGKPVADASATRSATGRRQLIIWMQVVPVIAVQAVAIVSVPEASEAVHGVMAIDTDAPAAEAVHATAGHPADMNTATKPSHAGTAGDATHVATAAKSSHVRTTAKTSHVTTAAKAATVAATTAAACLGRSGKQA
jgi:hypothetical protein